MTRINYSKLFVNPDNVSLVTDHGVKFATDGQIIWDISQFPLNIRERFEVIFEDERVNEGHVREAKVCYQSVQPHQGVSTLNESRHYETWLEFIRQHDQMALSKVRFSFADPAGTRLRLLYVPVCPPVNNSNDFDYLGAIPMQLLDAAERAIDGLRSFYCNDSREIIMLAKKVSRWESDGPRNTIHYYKDGSDGSDYELLRPAAFLCAPAQTGEGIVPGEFVDFIRENLRETWMFEPERE